MYQAGHEIASHTVTHSHPAGYTADRWAREIGGQADLLASLGRVPRNQVTNMFCSIGKFIKFQCQSDPRCARSFLANRRRRNVLSFGGSGAAVRLLHTIPPNLPSLVALHAGQGAAAPLPAAPLPRPAAPRHLGDPHDTHGRRNGRARLSHARRMQVNQVSK